MAPGGLYQNDFLAGAFAATSTSAALMALCLVGRIIASKAISRIKRNPDGWTIRLAQEALWPVLTAVLVAVFGVATLSLLVHFHRPRMGGILLVAILASIVGSFGGGADEFGVWLALLIA